jgi:hypothetical protein
VRVDIQMSVLPEPPGRSDENRSVRPSRDKSGCESAKGVFKGGPPRFSGADQESCTLRRVDTQMSAAPNPPARVEKNMISRPSVLTVAAASLAVGSFSSAIG